MIRTPLFEMDQRLRSRERAAVMDPSKREAHIRSLVRSGDHVGAARVALHDHGQRYLDAHRKAHESSVDPDDSDEAWRRDSENQTKLEKAHKEYRRAIHDFREKHGITHPKHAYYRKPTHNSHVGADSFAGKALPAFKGGSDEDRQVHARAVANAVTYAHDGSESFVDVKEGDHIEHAENHHHPDHKAEMEGMEMNPDGSLAYVKYHTLRPRKKQNEESVVLSRTPLLAEDVS